MFVGRVDNDPISIDTNVVNTTPIALSAMMLPILEHKNGNKLTVPQKPPDEVSMSNALGTFYKFLVRGPIDTCLGVELDWENRIPYEINDLSNEVYLKMDGIMSAIAYHKFKNSELEIRPFIMVYSAEEKEEMIEWLKSVGIRKKVPIIYIGYNNIDVSSIIKKYENWIACTIAAIKTSQIWLSIPPIELSDYFPDRTSRLFYEGSNWLTKMMGSNITITSPFAYTKTRYEIVKDCIDKDIIKEDFLVKAMRCNCGMCTECFMNFMMMKKLNMNVSELFNNNNKKTDLMKRIKKLIELDKLSMPLKDEILVCMK